MSQNKSLRALIKKHEGLKLHSYRDTEGKLSIGYGHNLDAHGDRDPGVITIDQAEKYLNDDIAEATAQCSKIIGWDQLNEARRAVLIDMCFNLGYGGLLQFKRMLHWIAKGYYQQAALEMADSVWALQVGKRAKELSEIMSRGEF